MKKLYYQSTGCANRQIVLFTQSLDSALKIIGIPQRTVLLVPNLS